MFGNNSVTSSWANPQQNGQQQPQQGATGFGQQQQPNAFGSGAGGAFGSGGGIFGQPAQQQQQPQQPANNMFGGFGAAGAGTSTGTTGFGAFGQNNASTTPAFNAPKPATGFGTFGSGGSTFGGTGTGAFGSTTAAAQPTATGAFGQPSTSSGGGAFGTSNLFGAKPATGFGATATAGTSDVSAPVTTGSSNPPYAVFTEKDQSTSQNLQYQSISCMPAYRGTSFEEIRLQDYQQNRKTSASSAGTGAFGSTTFGQPATQTTGIFGQPAQPAAAATPFGGFGANQQNAAAPAAGGFGGFGATTQPAAPAATTFGGFGQPQQQQQQQQQGTTGFGGFGQTQPQQGAATGTGLFGGGAFGQQQNKPAFGGFGTTTNSAQTNAFGQPANNTGTGTGLFGQQQPQAQTNTGAFGGFGASQNKPSIFGAPAQPAQPATTGFGLFGQQPNQQQNQQQGQQPAGGLFGAGTGLFGQNQQQNQQQQPGQQQPGGIFGNTQPAQQATGGLFGGGATGGGLFGNNQAQNQQQPAQQQGAFGGGLFGAKPATAPTAGGLFGGGLGQSTAPAAAPGAAPGAGLFGSTLGQNNAQPAAGASTFGGGLFGAKPAAPAFGASQSTAPGAAGSMFGNPFGASTATLNASAMAPGAQGTLTASIAQPIGASLPIFNMLPPGPRAISLEQPKKKPAFFADVPTRTPVPRLQLGYTPANTKLRGFASTGPGGNLGASLGFSTGPKSNVLTLGQASPTKSSTDLFVNGGGSGSGRQSVKKLILDKKVEPSHLLGRSASPSLSSSLSKVSFNPALSIAARQNQKDPGGGAEALREGTPQPRAPAPNRFTASAAAQDANATGKDAGADESKLQEGDYWSKPALSVLRQASYHELLSFSGLIVGREGYGQIEFLEPVDLTGVPRLDALLGDLVTFDDKECAVYPNSEDADKPPPGSGLNVQARITLYKCWAVDKATRQPIKDASSPAAVKHENRLRKMKNTKFESFDIAEGQWVFIVESF